MVRRESLELIRAYYRIREPRVRKQLLGIEQITTILVNAPGVQLDSVVIGDSCRCRSDVPAGVPPNETVRSVSSSCGVTVTVAVTARST